MPEYPRLLHTVVDTTSARRLAEFYRALLGLQYRPGDEPPADGTSDDADWLVLVDSQSVRKLAFQQVDSLPRTTWPAPGIPSVPAPKLGIREETLSRERPVMHPVVR